MKNILTDCGDGRKGAALITALLFLVILTALGMAAIMTSSTEVMISENDYKAKQAVYIADAGVQDVLAKLNNRKINPDRNSFATWSTSIPPVTVGDLEYRVVVKFRLEDANHADDDDGDPTTREDNDEMVRYNTGFNYPNSPVVVSASAAETRGEPVLTVTSVGRVKSAIRPATATVVMDITSNVLNVDSPGGMFSGGCLNIAGVSSDIEGNDTESGENLPGVVTNGTGCMAYPGTISGADGSGQTLASPPIDMETYLGVASLSEVGEYATETLPSSDPNIQNKVYGTYSSYPALVFANNETWDLTMNNVNGYGILVVMGNLAMSGDFYWNGLVFVNGNVTVSGGGGNKNITGGIMAGGDFNDIQGGITVNFNRNMLNRVTRNMFKYRIISWSQVYN